MRGRALVILTALVVVAAPVHGQVPAPAVVFDDVVVAQPIVPLQEPTLVPLALDYGCIAGETAEWRTDVAFSVTSMPGFVSAAIAPSPVSATAGITDCPLAIRTADSAILIGLLPDGPAFAPVTLSLSALITKTPPQGPSQAFGPFEAALTFEVGYFSLWNVETREKIKHVGSGSDAHFEARVTNLGNGETRFTFTAPQREDDVRVFVPGPIVLAPGESGDVPVVVSPQDFSLKRLVPVRVLIDAAYAPDPSFAGPSGELSLLAEFEATSSPSFWFAITIGVIVAVTATALFVWRGRSRSMG